MVPRFAFAAAGALLGHQAQPGAELRAAVELLEIAHRGHGRRGGDGTNAHEVRGTPHVGAVGRVRGQACIAPGQVFVEFTPLRVRSLQRHARQAVELVAGVLQDVVQRRLQRPHAGGHGDAELQQQPADAVDARGAIGLHPLAQAVHAQQALLLDALDRNKTHVRPACSLADRRGIVGVVLANVPLAAVRRGQVRRDDARVQPHGQQLARPVVGAGTDFHHDHAARWQLRAPGQELLAAQRPVRQHATARIDGLHLNHALGKIDAHTRRNTSGNLVHGTSPFNGCRLMTRTVNLGASTPLPEGGKSLHIPLNRTRYGKHRKPGPRHMVHHREPGLRCSPPQTG